MLFRSFEENGVWIVADFKTGEMLDAYRSQVALYAEAISAATKMSCRGMLIRL